MRLAAAKEAILYTFERQVILRNLTGAEILTTAQMIKGRKQKNGDGRAAEILAEKLGVSPSMVYHARAILKDALPEDLKAVRKGEASIKAVYNRTRQRQRPETEFAANDAQGLPGNVAFLKGAVILLAEQEHLPATNMLINHFLKKNEKAGFYKLLPVKISRHLPKLPLLNRSSN